MSPYQLASVKDCPKNVPLKFGQICSSEAPWGDCCLLLMLFLFWSGVGRMCKVEAEVRFCYHWVGVLTIFRFFAALYTEYRVAWTLEHGQNSSFCWFIFSVFNDALLKPIFHLICLYFIYIRIFLFVSCHYMNILKSYTTDMFFFTLNNFCCQKSIFIHWFIHFTYYTTTILQIR